MLILPVYTLYARLSSGAQIKLFPRNKKTGRAPVRGILPCQKSGKTVNPFMHMQKIFHFLSRRSFYLVLALALLCFGCASASPEEKAPPRDLAGFAPGLNKDAQNLYAKARILWNTDEHCSNPELALEYLEVAIALEPEYADAYMRKALAASQLGEWDEAFADSSRAIRLEQKADNYALRSLIFMREGNYLGAAQDLERARSIDPKNSRAQEYLKRLQTLKNTAP